MDGPHIKYTEREELHKRCNAEWCKYLSLSTEDRVKFVPTDRHNKVSKGPFCYDESVKKVVIEAFKAQADPDKVSKTLGDLNQNINESVHQCDGK